LPTSHVRNVTETIMRKFLLALVALVGLSTAVAMGNYAMTQGAGTTFGSVTVGGIHYVQMFLCDLTTPAQCGSVSAAGAVKVDGSAVTQPVSGTVAVTQSTSPWIVAGGGTAGTAATGVVTVQGIASMTPLFMSSATAPVSTMNSASANSGVNVANAAVFDDTSPTAITENSFGFLRMSANRNLYGTIRDAAGNERGANVNASNQLNVAGPVTMVSGAVASGAYASGAFASGAFASGSYASGAFATGSMVDLLTVIGTKNAGTASASSLTAGGVYNSTPLTLTNTQQSSHQLDANGYLKVNVAAGGAGGGAVTIASGAVASGAYSSGSIASGAMVDLGAQADAACGTATGTCSAIALLKYLNTQASSALPAGSALIGDVNLRQGGTALSATNGIFNNILQGNAVLSTSNPIFNRTVAGATGGASTTGNIAANNTTAVVVKASAGTLYGVQVYGIGSAPAYLKIYNATSATCGSGTPVKRLMIPAASTAANGAGSNITFGSSGIAFGTGITYCVTTGIGDSDTTAPAASTFLINVDWT
jgi:trimeric autotransporter adhesin